MFTKISGILCLPSSLKKLESLSFSYSIVSEASTIKISKAEMSDSIFECSKIYGTLDLSECIFDIPDNFSDCSCFDGDLYLPKKANLKIGLNAFNYSRISRIIINSQIKICERAFYKCYNLKEIIGLEKAIINEESFAYCTSLKEINTKSLSTSSFRESGLEKATIACIEVPNQCFRMCVKLKEVIFDPIVQVIQKRAFLGCAKLSVDLKSMTFSEYSFYSTSVTSVVTSENIYQGSFMFCQSHIVSLYQLRMAQ